MAARTLSGTPVRKVPIHLQVIMIVKLGKSLPNIRIEPLRPSGGAVAKRLYPSYKPAAHAL